MQQVSVERKATWEEKVRMLSIPKTVEERRCRLPYGLARGLTHVYSLVFEPGGGSRVETKLNDARCSFS